MKKMLHLLLHRLVLVGLAILLQLVLLVVVLVKFQNQFIYFYAVSVLISVLVVFYIINGRSNPAYKLAWAIPILLVPVFGGIFYLLFGGVRIGRYQLKKMMKVAENSKEYIPNARTLALEKLREEDIIGYSQSNYITNYAESPLCNHTLSEYLPSGEVKFQRLLEELQKAEHFIFLEYFIIEEGKMWNSVLAILEQKVKEGVDVRVTYDDMGCIRTLPYQYHKVLEQKGIQVAIFNPFVPLLSVRFNNRDHRKICVIDGYIGFTGGINLADEYINAVEKHGHWKDTAIFLRGDAVWNLTVMFLSMWDYIKGIQEDYNLYGPDRFSALPPQGDGYVQPFADSPLDGECVGETVYLNMINKAQKYIYITTPYLIIDNEMVTALTVAAKNGVDVRIITPHIADKWYVHAVTRAYYTMLVESGVRIYEYTPGFIHAKTYVCDDRYAVVGTINMDYRSLYLHFECGAWLCGSSSVAQIRDDFLATQEISGQVTVEDCHNISWLRQVGRGILRVFAPLM